MNIFYLDNDPVQHQLGHLLPAASGFHAGYHNHLAYKWAKVKLSKADGINGWFRRINI